MSEIRKNVGVAISQAERTRLGLDGPHMSAPTDVPEILTKIFCQRPVSFAMPELTIEKPRQKDWQKRVRVKRRHK